MKLIALVLFPLLVNVNGNSEHQGHIAAESSEGHKLMDILRSLPGKITHDYVPAAHAEVDMNDSGVDDTDGDVDELTARLMIDPMSDNGLATAEKLFQPLVDQLKPMLDKFVTLVSGTCLEDVVHLLITIFQTVMRNMMPLAAIKAQRKS